MKCVRRADSLLGRVCAAPSAFQYRTGHSVEEVSAADHGACTASNPLRSYKDQSTTIALTKPGTRYFICGTTGHCASGMKLAVTVVSGSSASFPATSSSTVLSAKPSSKPTGSDDATSAAAATTAAPGSSSVELEHTSLLRGPPRDAPGGRGALSSDAVVKAAREKAALRHRNFVKVNIYTVYIHGILKATPWALWYFFVNMSEHVFY
jgi:hypothetical protein